MKKITPDPKQHTMSQSRNQRNSTHDQYLQNYFPNLYQSIQAQDLTHETVAHRSRFNKSTNDKKNR